MANKKSKAFAKGLGSPALAKSLADVSAKEQRKQESIKRQTERVAEYSHKYAERKRKYEERTGKEYKVPFKPPRKRKPSDDIYNARRRMARAAERYAKKAEMAKGVEKARYQRMAQAKIEKSLLTYQKEPLGKTAELAEKLGVTRKSALAGAFAKGFTGSKKLTQAQITQVVKWSMDSLTGKAQERRDTMAKEILKIDNIGSRFYGGLIDIWGGSNESRSHPNQAILDYFGASSIMDVLEQLEAAGIDIYTPTENSDTYKSIQLRIQEFILASRNG